MLQPAYLAVALTSFTGAPIIVVGLHGSEKAVEWQRDSITAALIQAGATEMADEMTEDDVRHTVAGSSQPVKIKISIRPTDLPTVCERLQSLASAILCNVPNGIVEASLTIPDSAAQGDFDAVRREIEAITTGSGHLIWTALPAKWKANLDVWGPTRGDFSLMKGIKKAVDPHNLFSPGRFIGRL